MELQNRWPRGIVARRGERGSLCGLKRLLYALDAKTGGRLWSYKTASLVSTSPAVSNEAVYVGSADYNLYAFGLK